MSFTEDVTKEALSLQIKKPCCRRAFALGLFCGAQRAQDISGKKELSASFSSRETAEAVSEYLLKIFRAPSEICVQNKSGRISYSLHFCSSAVSDFLKSADGDDDRPPHIAIGFKCDGCEPSFLRGMFVACGSISDPKKVYHMELSFPTSERAEHTASMIGRRLFRMGRIKRGARHCLYCKSNSSIADFLYCIGCQRSGLAVTDSWIERDIRNNENRATNCVARNISLSVSASQKQISAIEQLIKTRKIDQLPEELRYTARLRMENHSASLSELAALHSPPITKSGLNSRLRRLIEASEEG